MLAEIFCAFIRKGLRLMEQLNELVFQALGEASMCWEPTPSGVFDSDRCNAIGETLVAAINAMVAQNTSANNARDEICPRCSGEGKYRVTHKDESAFVTVTETHIVRCSVCNGVGKLSPVA
jgi:hypothetical protein